MNICVIGTGISGLTCAHLLNKKHNVTLIEKQECIGFAHGNITLPGGCNIDIPLRIHEKGYYKNYSALMNDIGVDMTPVSLTMTLDVDKNISTFDVKSFLTNWKIIKDCILFKYYEFFSPNKNITFGGWLLNNKLTDNWYANMMLLNLQCNFTSTKTEVINYPVEYIFNYISTTNGLNTLYGWSRVKNGSIQLSKQISDGIKVITGCDVANITNFVDKVVLDTNKGIMEFDKVIVATECNIANKLLNIDMPFTISHSVVIVHTDSSVMPPNRNDWRPIHVIDNKNTAHLVVWLNQFYNIDSDIDYFHSWMPEYNNKLAGVIQIVPFTRPVHTLETMKWIETNSQKINDNVYIAGSYCVPGVTLQEEAVTSAFNVCKEFGIELPKKNPNTNMLFWFGIISLGFSIILYKIIVVI
jgi:predicted NAD/FAD-binding protein